VYQAIKAKPSGRMKIIPRGVGGRPGAKRTERTALLRASRSCLTALQQTVDFRIEKIVFSIYVIS
jgi:hypothetical protein